MSALLDFFANCLGDALGYLAERWIDKRRKKRGVKPRWKILTAEGRRKT